VKIEGALYLLAEGMTQTHKNTKIESGPVAEMAIAPIVHLRDPD
jgi:hypothetical protein